jgi:hypothetical protein
MSKRSFSDESEHEEKEKINPPKKKSRNKPKSHSSANDFAKPSELRGNEKSNDQPIEKRPEVTKPESVSNKLNAFMFSSSNETGPTAKSLEANVASQFGSGMVVSKPCAQFIKRNPVPKQINANPAAATPFSRTGSGSVFSKNPAQNLESMIEPQLPISTLFKTPSSTLTVPVSQFPSTYSSSESQITWVNSPVRVFIMNCINQPTLKIKLAKLKQPTHKWLSELSDLEFPETIIQIVHAKNLLDMQQLVWVVKRLQPPFALDMRLKMKKILCKLLSSDLNLTTLEPQLTFESAFHQFRMQYHASCGFDNWAFTVNTENKALCFNQPFQRQIGFLRFQSLDLCSCIAAAVFTEYIIRINRQGNFNNHLDVSKFLARNSVMLATTIHSLMENRGPELCLNYLNIIAALDCSQTKDYKAFDEPDICGKLLTHLKKYPILITSFNVELAFHNPSNQAVQFDEQPSPPPGGRQTHAMVMVGARYEDGKYFYLLQNFWRYRIFVEVSANYLDRCGAVAVFLKNPELLQDFSAEVPNDLRNNFDVAETLDGADSSEIPIIQEDEYY